MKSRPWPKDERRVSSAHSDMTTENKRKSIINKGTTIVLRDYSDINITNTSIPMTKRIKVINLARAAQLYDDVCSERRDDMSKLEVQALLIGLMNDFIYEYQRKQHE